MAGSVIRQKVCVREAPSVHEASSCSLPISRSTGTTSRTTKGSVTVVLGKIGPKGVETKDVSLFGPAGKDVATAVLPQVEGVAAIRFSFKREAKALAVRAHQFERLG